MWRRSAGNAAPRALAGVAALVLTSAVLLYAPIAMEAGSQGSGMATRTQLLLIALVLSAASTWMLVIRPENVAVRLATNLSCGFNLIWFVSFVGPPVVLASLLAAAISTAPAPRRLIPTLIAVVLAGFGLGLLVLRVTEPSGEHLFG